MAKGMRIVYPVTTTVELGGVQKTANTLIDTLTNKMSSFKIDFGKILPGESVIQKLGGYGEFFNNVRAGATDVGKLTSEYVLMEKTVNGVTTQQRIATKEITEMRGAAGQLSITTKDLTELSNAAVESFKKQGYTISATTKEVADLNKVEKLSDTAIKEAQKSTDLATKAAEDFLSKTKNMGGQQVKIAKDAANAVLIQAKAIQTLDKTSQAYADGLRVLSDKTREMNLAIEGTKVGANAFQGWITRIGNAIQQTVAYSFSIGLVYKAQQLLNDSIRYAIDLNTEMTKIQVLQAQGAQTPEEINALAQSFNKLGQEMGASTLEVAKGSVEWLRQGRTVEETQKLMRASMMLSKLGAMESADATNYLTSITNAFKIEVDDTTSVVDKLIAVDNIAATSAGELATALRYTSESAALAGVSMEQLISYIGTVSTVTRQNAEMIGQAFKTMFARMTLIQGGGTDEEGWTISKVEKALNAAGISVKNAEGNFRNMGDVLEETAAKWNTLGERERIEIAVAIAGVRQKEAFLVLMNNMDKALQYQTAQTDASGLAMDRYGIYMESVQAKQGKLTASMQELYTKTINSGTIKLVLDLANGLLSLLNATGGLGPAILALAGAFAILKKQLVFDSLSSFATKLINVVIPAIFGTTVATGGLETALLSLQAAIPYIGVALLAVSAIIAAVSFALKENKRITEESREAIQSYADKLSSIPSTVSNLSNNISESVVLLRKQEQGMRLSVEEADKLQSSLQQLYNTAPNMDWEFMEDGKLIIDSTKLSADALRESLVKLALIQSEVGSGDFKQNMADANKSYGEYTAAIEQATAQIEILKEAQNALSSGKEEDWDAFKKSAMESMSLGEGAWGKLGYEFTMGFSNVIQNESDPDKIALAISSQLSDATLIAMSNDGLKQDARKMWVTIISQALGKTDETSKMVMDYVASAIAGGNQIVLDAYNVAVGTVEEQSETTLIRIRQNAWDAAHGIGASAEEMAASYDVFSNRITKLGNATKKWDAISHKQDVGFTEKQDAIKGVLTTIQDLNKEGANLELKNLSDFLTLTGDIDVTGFDNYKKALIESIRQTLKFQDLTDRARASLQSMLDELIAIPEQITQIVEIGGQQFSMTQTQFEQFADASAQTLYDLAKNEQGIVISTADNGKQVMFNNAADMSTAMKNNYAYFVDFVVKASIAGKISAADLAKYLIQVMNTIKAGIGSIPTSPYVPPVGGGGGGGSQPNPRIKQIEEEIKRLEKQKKALQEQIEKFKEYIDKQKESLKRAKDEADFLDELAKKHKALGKIKARLAILALDDSEEAQKERLELEEEAAEKELEIKEFVEDRKYELMIQALEDMQKAFEDAINAQIDKLDELIDKLNEEKQSLQDVGNTGGAAFGGMIPVVESLEIALKKLVDETMAKFGNENDPNTLFGVFKISRDMIEKMTQKWADQGLTIDQIKQKLQQYIDLLKANEWAEKWKPPIPGKPTNPEDLVPPQPNGAQHFGGLVEEHHGGEFAGNLQSNEVFSKLLKGEYVATEGQMDNFLKNILPKVTGGMVAAAGTRLPANQTGYGNDGMNVEIQINVAGSLDKKAIPNLKKEMLDALNKSMERRGMRRTATNFSV